MYPVRIGTPKYVYLIRDSGGPGKHEWNALVYTTAGEGTFREVRHRGKCNSSTELWRKSINGASFCDLRVLYVTNTVVLAII